MTEQLPDEPKNREELYLANIAGQNVTLPDEPKSRKEEYLANIAGQDVILPEKPCSREEQYLAYIAENGSGGGGGGGETTVPNYARVKIMTGLLVILQLMAQMSKLPLLIKQLSKNF